jgi:hypothetical protein
LLGNARMATRKSSSRGRSSAKTRSRKSSGRRYGAKASSKVEENMHEMKRGELRSGRSGKKVTSRKQAIAIGLSEARRAGGKVPARKGRKTSRKTSRKTASKSSGARKTSGSSSRGKGTRRSSSRR